MITNETKLAYLAGVIDARGWINFSISSNRDYKRGIALTPHLGIMCLRPPLKQVINDSGFGWLTNVTRIKDGIPIYYATIRNLEGIVFFLKQILPYLITHKKSAELMISFCESRLNNRTDGGKYLPYTDADIALVDKIRLLYRNRAKTSPLKPPNKKNIVIRGR